MRRYEVVYDGHVVHKNDSGEPLPFDSDLLQAQLSEIMEELIDLDPASDPIIGGSIDEGGVRINVTVSARRPEEAVIVGNSMIRTAVHAAGGHTPDWSIDWLSAQAVQSPDESGADTPSGATELVEA